ncbi:MAG: YicC family protein [Deltaproteobacteria bacterium]|nr:MAG: YicC family protein [Deltaproteobacteria bacterium]
MIKSMTAYGRGEHLQEGTLYIAEIRSLNHRHRDIVLRLPKNLLALEKDLTSLISSRIRRGRIEVYVEMLNQTGDIPYTLELNMPLAESYFDIFHRLSEQFGVKHDFPLDSLWQMKDVIVEKPVEIDLDRVRHGFLEALSQAIDPLDRMKIREGEAIEADFRERTTLLEKYLDEMEKRAPELVEKHRRRLKNNLARLLDDVPVDEERLAREVAFFAEKSDITEEIVRIRSHLIQFREYLSADTAIGRRLDFLIQEINREVNTIGSKISDTLCARIVVEMKAELEKLREQAQNVE